MSVDQSPVSQPKHNLRFAVVYCSPFLCFLISQFAVFRFVSVADSERINKHLRINMMNVIKLENKEDDTEVGTQTHRHES